MYEQKKNELSWKRIYILSLVERALFFNKRDNKNLMYKTEWVSKETYELKDIHFFCVAKG